MVLALVTVPAQHAKITVTLTAEPGIAEVMNVQPAAPPAALTAIARPPARKGRACPPLGRAQVALSIPRPRAGKAARTADDACHDRDRHKHQAPGHQLAPGAAGRREI
jgi:hypothetical protein